MKHNPPSTDRGVPAIGSTQTRELRIDQRAIDLETRTVELAFSSEAPVERRYGREILDHRPGACRLGRLAGGAPLLINHEPEDQIGAVLEARIDGDRVGRAKCKVSRSADGEDILMDLADGIRSKASVGYIIHAMQFEGTQDGVEIYRITDWEPVEISLVSIPADPSVGVGRSFPYSPPPKERPMDPEELDPLGTDQGQPQTPTDQRAAPAPADPAAANPEAEAIRACARHFGEVQRGEDHLMLGGSLQEFRALMRTKRSDPVPTAPPIAAHIPHAGNLRAFRPELYAGGRREAEEAAYRAGQWAMAVLFQRADSARWCRDHGVPIAAPGVGQIGQRTLTGLAVGQAVVVPDELILPIIDLRAQYGIARRLCRVHPMASDTASIPRATGGATAYFVGREAAPSASDPTFDNINLVAKNLAAETRISNDFADDSVINLADYVAQEHALAFATKEDNCLFNGDGTSAYGGIVGLRTAILGLAGAVDAAANHDTFAEIDAADLGAVMAKLPDIPGLNPVWITSKVGQHALFGRLTQAVSGNRKADLAAAMPQQWMGYDILTSNAMPKVLTDLSDVAMALFGDLRMGVVLGDRRGMTMLVDPYSLSSYQQTKIVSSERFDMNCFGVGDASNAGPIVALIGE